MRNYIDAGNVIGYMEKGMKQKVFHVLVVNVLCIARKNARYNIGKKIGIKNTAKNLVTSGLCMKVGRTVLVEH